MYYSQGIPKLMEQMLIENLAEKIFREKKHALNMGRIFKKIAI